MDTETYKILALFLGTAIISFGIKWYFERLEKYHIEKDREKHVKKDGGDS